MPRLLQYRTGQATTKIAISDFLEMASSGQEDECLQDCDRILADLVGGNVAHDESSSVNAEVLGSNHSGSGEGNPTSSRKRHGHLLEKSSSRRTQTVGKIQCRLGVRALLAGAQTASTHCKDGKFNHPENCNENEATGLVAFSQGELDRQALWPPPGEVCVLEMGNAIRKLVRNGKTCAGEKLAEQSGLDGESRKQKRLERGRKEFRKQHTAMTRTESTSCFSV